MLDNELYLSGLVQSAMDAIISVQEDQKIIFFNPAAEKIFGYRSEEIIGQPLDTLIPQRFHSMHHKDVQLFGHQGVSARSMTSQGELVAVRSNGEEFPIEASISKIELGGTKFFSAILRDISERKRMEKALQENEARLTEMFEILTSGVATYKASSDGQDYFFTGFNKAAERIEKTLRADLLGKNVKDVFPAISEFGLLEVFKRVWKTGKAEKFSEKFYSDGRVSGWRENYVCKLANGEIVAIYNDLTQEKQMEDKMRHLAHFDQLTGLPNRTLLFDRLRQAIDTAKQEKSIASILFIDLDKFKPINDLYGHEAGDLLLKEAANRMRACVRKTDTISRIGGDEFIILLLSLDSEARALQIAEEILLRVSQPYTVLGHNVEISASIGVAFFSEDVDDEKVVIKHADEAMYDAKHAGRNRIAVYGSLEKRADKLADENQT